MCAVCRCCRTELGCRRRGAAPPQGSDDLPLHTIPLQPSFQPDLCRTSIGSFLSLGEKFAKDSPNPTSAGIATIPRNIHSMLDGNGYVMGMSMAAVNQQTKYPNAACRHSSCS